MKTCGRCGFQSSDGEHCGLTGIPVDPKTDGCTKGQTSPIQCDICNKFIFGIKTLIPKEDGSIGIVCGNCANHLTSCRTCSKSVFCDFETNPSKIPKMIQKRIQQGSMISVSTVKNPDRIEVTCKKNCECFSENFGCLRENNCCEKYDLILK